MAGQMQLHVRNKEKDKDKARSKKKEEKIYRAAPKQLLGEMQGLYLLLLLAALATDTSNVGLRGNCFKGGRFKVIPWI